MTRVELQRELLGLPDEERMALVGLLLDSLQAGDRAALRRRWEALDGDDLRRLERRLESQIDHWFRGPGEAMGEAEWTALLSGEATLEPEADSWAVPPGWKPTAGSGSR